MTALEATAIVVGIAFLTLFVLFIFRIILHQTRVPDYLKRIKDHAIEAFHAYDPIDDVGQFPPTYPKGSRNTERLMRGNTNPSSRQSA